MIVTEWLVMVHNGELIVKKIIMLNSWSLNAYCMVTLLVSDAFLLVRFESLTVN